MKYSKTARIIAWIFLFLFLVSVISVVFSGCRSAHYAKDSNDNTKWALIKIGGGEPLHVEVDRSYITSQGIAYIWTKDGRQYTTSMVNVLFIADIG